MPERQITASTVQRKTVARQAAEELQEIEEIKEMRSSSRSGISTVTIELKDTVYAVDEVWSGLKFVYRIKDRK